MLDKIKKLQQKYAIPFVRNTKLKGDMIILKFQNNNTTFIANPEDFILTVYVVIDDLYHQFAPSEVIHRRHVLDAKL